MLLGEGGLAEDVAGALGASRAAVYAWKKAAGRRGEDAKALAAKPRPRHTEGGERFDRDFDRQIGRTPEDVNHCQPGDQLAGRGPQQFRGTRRHFRQFRGARGIDRRSSCSGL